MEILRINRERLQHDIEALAAIGRDEDYGIYRMAKIAKNPIFVAVLQMVHENILGRWLKFSPTDENVFQENYEDLCDIVAAVERGESNKARVLAHDHVSRFHRYMERGKEKV